MQSRLGRTRGKKPMRLLDHPRFRAAYDFLLLRNQAGENLDDLCNWWTQYQQMPQEQRRKQAHNGNKRRRRKKQSHD
jgi:poly(A) polymerase